MERIRQKSELTEADRAEREKDDGERDEDGARCACNAVPKAFEPFKTAEHASRETSRHPGGIPRARKDERGEARWRRATR